jgi:hypothetical protein
LKLDYGILISEFNLTVGYLQVDIDPAPQSLAALRSLLLQDIRFAGITFEHDRYAVGGSVQNYSRQLLRRSGYIMVRGNVTWSPGSSFEDWWVDPNQVSKEGVRALKRKILGVWRPVVGPFGM